LNERARAATTKLDSLWHVDDGQALFVGPLHRNALHRHCVPVYLAGLYGTFRLRIARDGWLSCRTAVIPARVPYEFDMGGEPLAVFYLEPNVASVDALTNLVRDTRGNKWGPRRQSRRDIVTALDLRRPHAQKVDRSGIEGPNQLFKPESKDPGSTRISCRRIYAEEQRRTNFRATSCELRGVIILTISACVYSRSGRSISPLPVMASAADRSSGDCIGEKFYKCCARGWLCRSGPFLPRIS